MTTFTAIQAGSAGCLYAADAQTPSATWVGYYLPSAVAAKPPQTLGLDQSWTEYWGVPIKGVPGGSYVFFAAAPAPGTADKLGQWLANENQHYAYRYLAWFTQQADGSLTNLGAVAFAAGNNSATGSAPVSSTVQLRTLWLQVSENMKLTIGTDQQSIVVAPVVSASLGLQQTRDTPKDVGDVTSAATIPLAGPAPGALAFSMNLSTAKPADLETLVTGLRYFYDDAPAGNQPAVRRSQLFPVLGAPRASATLPFAVTIDPLHPTDATRTRFTLGQTSVAPFTSSLTTTTGIPLTLTPVPGSAGFTLAPDRVTPLTGPPQIDSYYAALAGDYTVGLPPGTAAPAGALPLLCGMSGLEAVTVTPGDTLRFQAGNPAYAPSFPPSAVTLIAPPPDGGDAPKLTTDMITSWVQVVPASGASDYHAQPHGAPLFGGDADLGLYPLVQNAASQATAAFPLASYNGLAPGPAADAFDPGKLQAFEQAVLSPTRRAAIVPPAPAPAPPTRAPAAAMATDDPTGDTTTATTPQGFLVEVAPGGAWSSLDLARTVVKGQTQVLGFSPVDPRVQAAFQTNQLALVASQQAWTQGFENSIAIEGWPFQVDVPAQGTFGAYSNVVIAKFCMGKLVDLVADPQHWTDASVFNESANNGLVGLSAWLQSYLAAAVASTDAAFDYFKSIVQSDTWQGILVLRVDVPLDDLPAEVGALRAGLPAGTFYAHHLGIEVSKVGPDLKASGSSSLFGLIDYIDPAYAPVLASGNQNNPIAPAPGQTYDFKVLRLLVSFQNSEVKEFQCKAQVSLNQWFGDTVTSTRLGVGGGSISNSIVIDGALQRHGGTPVYVFGAATDTVFSLGGQVLQSVEVTTTSLATIVDRPKGLSTFRFAFTGALGFGTLPAKAPGIAPDVFSFGPAPDAPRGGGLAFSSLYLEMGYDPQAQPPRTFTFDPTHIAFDSSAPASNIRTGGMFAALPLTLKGLVVGSDGGPSAQGYLPVSMQGANLATLGDQWYGLLFDLDLGGPGALAADVGWTAQLLAAWSPSTKSPLPSAGAPASVGLHLPGAGGQSKLLSLQGVLHLTIDQIQLLCATGSTADEPVYLLKLTGIALEFLMLKFPPSGTTALYLFGDPSTGIGQRSPSGWFAAYVDPPPPKALPA